MKIEPAKMAIPSLKMAAIPEQPPAQEAPSEQKSKKMGLGLDLSRAKTIQQEILEKNEEIIQRAKENVNTQS